MEEAGVDFTGEKAYEVTDYLIDLLGNLNFVVDADGFGIAGLRDGSIVQCLLVPGTPVENMGKGIRNKTITHENSQEQTDAMNDAMNSDGI